MQITLALKYWTNNIIQFEIACAIAHYVLLLLYFLYLHSDCNNMRYETKSIYFYGICFTKDNSFVAPTKKNA